MRTDKKSEFLKALKRDRVEEEHEEEGHAGSEKVTLVWGTGRGSIGPVPVRTLAPTSMTLSKVQFSHSGVPVQKLNCKNSCSDTSFVLPTLPTFILWVFAFVEKCE